ncbi:MAG: hypothetical protein NZ958_03405 [Bacteroidia bacterium]|nr:hypothetical protein [Bacteroidia bacterium]MDW8088265.1 hypothetical protein [Bacteroidia bacterium]
MSWRLFLSLAGLGAGWTAGNRFYQQLQSRAGWCLHGEGPLWDSLALARKFLNGSPAPSLASLWEIYQKIQHARLFEKIKFYYTGNGGVCVCLKTRSPLALVSLPGRQYYVDASGQALEVIRPLPLPIIEALRWDTLALHTFAEWWASNPWFYQATSHLNQRTDGVWVGHLEIAPEDFILGRSEHLGIALSQWRVYLQRVQPLLGANSCKEVLLFVPGQIICR